MAIVTFRLTEVKSQAEERPSECPQCGSAVLQGWGWVRKPVRDSQVREVRVQRFRCTDCGRTFRHYPSGVGAADQSLRLAQLAVLSWMLGLSLRAVSGVLSAFQIPLAHMTVWRDVQHQAAIQQARGPRRVRVLGLDGFGSRIRGQRRGVLLAVDLGTGQPLTLGEVPEADPRAVVKWLKPLLTEWGVEVLVSDDLHSYGVVADELGLRHQVCRFHVRRWVRRALRELAPQVGEAWQATLDEVQQVLQELPADGRWRLYQLWERLGAPRGHRQEPASALHRLRRVVLRLHDEWEQYTLFQREPGVPATNNGSERAIGRWRVRSRSVRGFKSWAGLEAAFQVCNGPSG